MSTLADLVALGLCLAWPAVLIVVGYAWVRTIVVLVQMLTAGLLDT